MLNINAVIILLCPNRSTFHTETELLSIIYKDVASFFGSSECFVGFVINISISFGFEMSI